MNPLCKSMNFLREHASSYINAAKDSPRVPDYMKPHLDTPCRLVSTHVHPVLEKCDSKLENIIPVVNEKIATVTDKLDPYVQAGVVSYSEGGVRKVANDMYAHIVDPKSVDQIWPTDLSSETDEGITDDFESESDKFSILSHGESDSENT